MQFVRSYNYDDVSYMIYVSYNVKFQRKIDTFLTPSTMYIPYFLPDLINLYTYDLFSLRIYLFMAPCMFIDEFIFGKLTKGLYDL